MLHTTFNSQSTTFPNFLDFVLLMVWWWKNHSDFVENHLDFFVVFFFTASTTLSAAFERRGDLTGLVVALVSCFLLLSFVGLFLGLSSFSTTFPSLTPVRFITDDQHLHSPESQSRNSMSSLLYQRTSFTSHISLICWSWYAKIWYWYPKRTMTYYKKALPEVERANADGNWHLLNSPLVQMDYQTLG